MRFTFLVSCTGVCIYIYQDFTSAYLNDALGCSLQKEHWNTFSPRYTSIILSHLLVYNVLEMWFMFKHVLKKYLNNVVPSMHRSILVNVEIKHFWNRNLKKYFIYFRNTQKFGCGVKLYSIRSKHFASTGLKHAIKLKTHVQAPWCFKMSAFLL